MKYSKWAARIALDRPFFEAVDRLGPWFPLPFPEKKLLELHNRETFFPKDDKQPVDFFREWNEACSAVGAAAAKRHAK